MKKDNNKKLDTFAVIDNYNFCDKHTYIKTWRLYDRNPNRTVKPVMKLPKVRQNIKKIKTIHVFKTKKGEKKEKNCKSVT